MLRIILIVNYTKEPERKGEHGDLAVRWMLSFQIIAGETVEPFHPT